MSEQPQPSDASNLPPTWGQVNGRAFDTPLPDRAFVRQRVNKALEVIERHRPAPLLRRFTVERVGNDACVRCWCGKTRTLAFEHVNVFIRAFDSFLAEHSWCEEPGQEDAE